MHTEVNIALIGFGRMGRIYAQALTQMPGARLAAVATTALDAEGDAINAFGVPAVFADARDAFALDVVDAVVIATPTDSHCELVLEAASAGKAIFCEKPLALSLADTRKMIEAVEAAGIPLQVGFMRRFDARFAEAKSAIERGDIGNPVSFRGVGRDPFCPPPSYADPDHSGGLILDMGIHDFDLARWLMGSEVERVSAEGTTLVCEDLLAVGDFDNAVVNFRFADGGLGSVEVSRTAFYGYDIRTEVLGSRAAVRVGHTDFGTEMLTEAAPNPEADYLVKRFGDAYRKQVHHFIACLQKGMPPTPDGKDALAAFEIGLAATYSARTGRAVTIDEVRAGWTPSSVEA